MLRVPPSESTWTTTPWCDEDEDEDEDDDEAPPCLAFFEFGLERDLLLAPSEISMGDPAVPPVASHSFSFP